MTPGFVIALLLTVPDFKSPRVTVRTVSVESIAMLVQWLDPVHLVALPNTAVTGAVPDVVT